MIPKVWPSAKNVQYKGTELKVKETRLVGGKNCLARYWNTSKKKGMSSKYIKKESLCNERTN
jgi:hypothetical protein